jgi:hypothetical protein
LEGRQNVNDALSGFVAEVDAFSGFRRNYVPVIAIQALAVNHLLHGAIFQLDVGGMCESALQTHFWFEKSDHL